MTQDENLECSIECEKVKRHHVEQDALVYAREHAEEPGHKARREAHERQADDRAQKDIVEHIDHEILVQQVEVAIAAAQEDAQGEHVDEQADEGRRRDNE